MKKFNAVIQFCMFCSLLLMGGCLASRVNSEATILLEQNYLLMTDAELVTYDQQLSDKLLELTQSTSSGDLGVGLGFGSWSGNVGYGIYADKHFDRSGASADFKELEQRRLEVREEMRDREIISE